MKSRKMVCTWQAHPDQCPAVWIGVEMSPEEVKKFIEAQKAKKEAKKK